MQFCPPKIYPSKSALVRACCCLCDISALFCWQQHCCMEPKLCSNPADLLLVVTGYLQASSTSTLRSSWAAASLAAEQAKVRQRPGTLRPNSHSTLVTAYSPSPESNEIASALNLVAAHQPSQLCLRLKPLWNGVARMPSAVLGCLSVSCMLCLGACCAFQSVECAEHHTTVVPYDLCCAGVRFSQLNVLSITQQLGLTRQQLQRHGRCSFEVKWQQLNVHGDTALQMEPETQSGTRQFFASWATSSKSDSG
jgi:hypothetical protein